MMIDISKFKTFNLLIFNNFFAEISRGCEKEENPSTECKTTAGTTRCQCTGDLCNSAPSISTSVTTVSFMTSLILYTLLN